MRVVTFTSLYPNKCSPNLGGFIARRMETWARRYAEYWSVVAPVPYFPRSSLNGMWAKYAKYGQVPNLETRGAWSVRHPRYLMLAKVGSIMQGAMMAHAGIRTLKNMIKCGNIPDLIDAHYLYPDGYAAIHIGRVLDIPVVVSGRGSDVNYYPEIWYLSKKVSRVLKEANLLIAVSQAMKKRMISLGANDKACVVIGNGVNLDHFRPKVKPLKTNGKHRLLAVGNLVPEKGFSSLLESFRSVLDCGFDVELEIVGAGPEHSVLRQLCNRLGLDPRVRFAGQAAHESMPEIYQNSDMLCLSSQREGCPNIVLEALASGLPVAAYSVGGVPELVHDGVNGCLAKENDPVDLARAIKTVLNKKWDPFAVRSTVEERSWESVSDEVQRVFCTALATYKADSHKSRRLLRKRRRAES